jgi:hypothetical protein
VAAKFLQDRRWIFLMVGLLVVALYTLGKANPLANDAPVQAYYDTIEALPPGSIVLLSADFDPGSVAELLPMFEGTVHHLFEHNLRIISTCTWPAAPPLARSTFSKIAPLYHKTYGQDWVELGFLVGDDVAMGLIGQSLRSAYPTDSRNQAPYEKFPILRDVSDSSRGISLLITISAGFPGILEWIPQLATRYGVPVLAGATAVQTPSMYPYYPNPLKGFLGAATGATQYLQLLAQQVPGVDSLRIENQRRMLVQSWAHVLIVLLILAGNVSYFASRKKAAR